MSDRKQDCLISIIVIVYKNKKDLSACLDSVLSQKGEDLEILVVDDASPDGCGVICDAYEKQDPRVRVWHHEKNGGASAARNTGLAHARGKWIAFMDGDDLLPSDAVDIMREYKNSRSDMVVFGTNTFFDGLPVPDFQPRFSAALIEGGEAMREYKTMVFDPEDPKREDYRYIHRVSPWARLFRREFLEKYHIHFNPALRRAEDHVFTFEYAHFLKSVELVPRCTYCYRIGNGVSYRFSEDALETHTATLACFEQILKKYGEDQDGEMVELLHRRYAGSLRFTIDLSIAHPDCKWKKEERLAWIGKLCSENWVRLVSEEALSRGRNDLAKAVIEKDPEALDAIFLKMRRKRTLKHKLRSTGLGKFLHRIYRMSKKK